MAAAADTFDALIFLQLCLGDSTDASCIEICFFRLYTSKAAQLQDACHFTRLGGDCYAEAPIPFRILASSTWRSGWRQRTRS